MPPSSNGPVPITAAEADMIVLLKRVSRGEPVPLPTAGRADNWLAVRVRELLRRFRHWLRAEIARYGLVAFLAQWTGCGLGLFGAGVLALKIDVSRYGWIAFLIANFAMIVFAKRVRAGGLLTQQWFFMITSCVGIYRSFDAVHAAVLGALRALGLH